MHALGTRDHTKVGCVSQERNVTLRFFAGAAGAAWSATAVGGEVVVVVIVFADATSVLPSVAVGDVDITCHREDRYEGLRRSKTPSKHPGPSRTFGGACCA